MKKLEITARGHVRRARLYYLRQLAGKKARLRTKVRDVSGLVAAEAGTAAEALAVPGVEVAPPVAEEAEAASAKE